MTGDVARRNGHSKSPYSTSVTGASAVRRDPDRLRADRGSEAGEQAVQLDFVGGARSGVNGTPTVYVDGVRPDGPHTAGTLGAAIEKGLPGG